MDNNKLSNTGVSPWVSRWLLVGLIMVFIQVLIGGITRLTDSGLSITEWEIVKGTLPPLNAEQWNVAFEAYKQAASKQYESLHAGMSLSEFKWIYFWEYFHRLWARTMGFVFIIPFLIFWRKGMLPNWLMRMLGIIILLAAAEATFGWIMVDSGLNDDTRTWVSTYKLIIHLIIATVLFGFLYWTYLRTRFSASAISGAGKLKHLANISIVVLLIQILFGGLMAGMRAALIHPHFPMFVESGVFFDQLGQLSQLNTENIINYEPSGVVKTWVQFLHRATAYVLCAILVYLGLKAYKFKKLKKYTLIMLACLVLQIVLGIVTVVSSIGTIPLIPALLHQAVALILLISLLHLRFLLKST